MAELILRADISPTYEVGDVLHAFNDRHIGAVHIEHICDVRKTGFNSDGLRPSSLCSKQRSLVYEYIFVRVSQTEIQRINRVTGVSDIIGPAPNGTGEYIDVELYLKRRITHAGHAIFGSKGNEFWFGGKVDASASKVNEVWSFLEGDEGLRRTDYKKFPLGRLDGYRAVAISTADFEDGLANALEMPLAYSKQDELLARRACYVDVYSLDEISEPIKNSIANPGENADARDYAEFIPEEIVNFRGI